MPYDYDMIVIGAGAAGLTAAGMSAVLGAKTALVEAHRLGGDCTWYGCIPSKTLLHAAKLAHDARNAERRPLISAQLSVDFPEVMELVRRTRQHVYESADAPPNLEKLGVTVLQARARFRNAHTLELVNAAGEMDTVTSRFFVIATGSRPRSASFEASVLTNESIFELIARPQHFVILGAGPVGIEMAQAFQRLGSSVTVVTSESRILPKDDPELTQLLREKLEGEGVQFVFGDKANQVLRVERGGVEVLLDRGQRIKCDAVLSAMGRQPNVEDLNLQSAGVAFNERGISVNRRCRTSQSHIYAVGGVVGRYQFTHVAEHMSKVAVTNAILRIPRSVKERYIVWCTFTDPELASLGESEAELRKRNARFFVYRLPFDKIDRAITEQNTSGLIQVFADRHGRILGVTILGRNAGDMISEWALAMHNGIALRNVAETLHPYPTYSLGNRQTADQWYTRQLGSPFLRVLGKLLRYRGEPKVL
jgi:pyruvate/2-oxoglutarate dehydrogenase complex dihydrolipoamide dehydrogenase (E3) component